MEFKLQTTPCLWESLKNEYRPIFLYGTGNGADKILDTCNNFSITVRGVFASSDFVRNRTFRGMQVKSLEDITYEYGNDIIVLLAFGTIHPSVIDNINKIAKNHTLYIPEVPLFGDDLFDREYYNSHTDEINKAYSLFEDEYSRLLYKEMIDFRLFGTPGLLHRVETMVDSYTSLLSGKGIKTVIDCGAFKGDSTDDIITAISPKEVYAFEPDPKTFIKLSNYSESENRCTVYPMNYALGSCDYESEFHSSGSRGSGIEGANHRGKTTTITTKALDGIFSKKIDMIKFDVEGNERDAICGARKIIERDQPAIALSLYHRSSDIFELPLLIKELCPDHKFYLRRVPCIPAWDISLIAVKQ